MAKPDSGLLHALVLDGHGGARPIDYQNLDRLVLGDTESLWLHWDRSSELARTWLETNSGLSDFACDLLLEENTRPRLVMLPDDAVLLFMRGLNLNPDAVPEDMVSLRIHASERRVISLRLRPLRATEEVLRHLSQGRGPRTASDVLLYLADSLTERIDELVVQLGEQIDREEDRLEADPRYKPGQDGMFSLRRTAASLRRFLLPQRELYSQMTRNRLPWSTAEDTDYWNELSNRLVRFIEELDLVRERVNLVLEAEQRRRSDRMTRTMYLLGITTGFFLPMTFVTGLLGMNVGGIPGADNPYGFIAACLVVGGIAVLQWWVFRLLRWL